jgi:transposase
LVQQVEIITGTERRRRWSEDEKRDLVSAAFGRGAIIAQVARQYGVAESCLYAWRKRYGASGGDKVTPDRPGLIPVMIEDASRPATVAAARSETAAISRHAIITLPDGTRLEIGAEYPILALKALVAALRPTR